jgi:ATP-dependent DNA helicase DinG
LLSAGLQWARGLVDWQQTVGDCERAARELRLCAGQSYSGAKLRWTQTSPETIDTGSWTAALDGLAAALLRAVDALDTVSEIAPDFVRLKERATLLAERTHHFVNPCASGCVRWVDVGSQLRLTESPLTIAQAVKTRLLGRTSESTKSWIFTSATLGDDEGLSWFTQPCGLEDARVLKVGSPFDYARQAALYVPPEFPKPADPAHSAFVAQAAALWAYQLGGRTMVLTTTLRALRLIGDALQAAFESSGKLEVLIQGTMPKMRLIERFVHGNQEGQKGCVLVASSSFWEGIDLPGDVLEMVIIDKLPFPPPNDPMAEARSKALEAEGRNAFSDYFLPETAVALKQGAGRLIRRETDQGVLVVCDTRLITMGYGKRLLRALPPMQRLAGESDLLDRLETISKR